MTEFFQDTPPEGADILKLMQYRIQQGEKRDKDLADKLDKMLDLQHDIKIQLALGNKRMETHSGLIEALGDESESIKDRHRIEIEAIKKVVAEEIRTAVAAGQAKSEPVTVWTAITGAGSGLGAAAYLIYMALTGKTP